MPKNITTADVTVDPVAAWRGAIPQPEPAVVLDWDPAAVPLTTSTASNVTVEITQPAKRFCIQCGAEGITSAKFCYACGSPLDPAPVASSFAVEAASRVTAAQMEQFRPKPEYALTPEERADRERQHIEAVKAGQRDPALRYEAPSGQRPTILIHFREDGLTFAGQVWMRGQEIELEEGTQRWQEAQSWIHMSPAQQFERFGKIMFAPGPWPGRRSYTEGAGSFEQLDVNGQRYTGPNAEALAAADLKEQQRRRGVPAPIL